ncbi:nuclear transport factor 2 family protein [Noviherbaspirillum agri]
MDHLERLIAFYHDLTPQSVTRIAELYSTDAYFKDPFNEVRGVDAVQRVFTHMFRQVDAPRFTVTEHVADENGAMLAWEFRFRLRLWGHGENQVIRGASHLKFDGDGKVSYHRDYWDAAEEVYAKLPAIGGLMCMLRKKLAA